MEKKINFIEACLIIVLAAAVMHSIFYFGVNKSLNNVDSKISGFSVVNSSVLDEKEGFSIASPVFSVIIIFAEWGLVIFLVMLVFIKQKIELRKEIEELEKERVYGNSQTKTDLDVFYNLLQNKKHLKVSTISRFFNVSKETAMNWCNILEMGNLATLSYPRIGEPEIRINSKTAI